MKLSPERAKLARELWEGGTPLVRVAIATGVNMDILRRIRSAEGWSRGEKVVEKVDPPPPAQSAAELRRLQRQKAEAERQAKRQKIADLYAEGTMTVLDIAVEVGVSESTVKHVAREFGLKRTRKLMPKRYPDELRQKIADLYSKHNVTVAGLALRFRIKPDGIRAILKQAGVYDGLRTVKRFHHHHLGHTHASFRAAVQRIASRG